MVLVSERVHRLPKAIVLIRLELALFRQFHERLGFPRGGIALDVIDYCWLQHKETAVDPGAVAGRLFLKTCDTRVVDQDCAVASRRLNSRERRASPVRSMKIEQLSTINTYSS